MKRIGWFFTLIFLTLTFAFTGVFVACNDTNNDSSNVDTPLSMDEIIAVYEQGDYASRELEFKIEAKTKTPMYYPQGTFLLEEYKKDLKIAENLQSKEADYCKKINGDNGTWVDYYLRGDEAFNTYYYNAESPEIRRNLQPTIKSYVEFSIFNEFEDFGLDIEIGTFEKEDTSIEEMHSLFNFAEKYGALTLKENCLTFDLNKLIYNIIDKLSSVFEEMDKETTIGGILANETMKTLIDDLADGTTALEMYEEMEESGLWELFSDSNETDKFKPKEGQSFYDYIIELLNSEDLVEEMGLGDYLGDTLVLGDVKVFSLFGETEEEAKEAIEKLGDLFKDVKENEFILDFSDMLGGEFFLSIKDMVFVFEVDEGRMYSIHVKGEISFKDNVITTQSLEMKLDIHGKYFKEEQPLADLKKFNYYTGRTQYAEGDMGGYAAYVAPNEYKVPAIVITNGEIAGLAIKDVNTNERVLATYNASKNVYEYSLGGYDMYARIVDCNSYHFGIEFYFNDGTDKFFNHTIIYIEKETKTVAVTYEEYKNPSKEEESTFKDEIVCGVLRYEYDEVTDSYTVLGFQEGSSVTNLQIPDSVNGKPVRKIASNAFYNDEKLQSVVIPKSVQYIDYLAFDSCSNLRTVEVNGAILSEKAFFCCSMLETITLNGTTIIKSAIGNSHNLKNIVISKELKYIERTAFYTWNITNVAYEGTIEEWLKIEKTQDWDWGLEFIVCSDGTLDVDGNVVNS